MVILLWKRGVDYISLKDGVGFAALEEGLSYIGLGEGGLVTLHQIQHTYVLTFAMQHFFVFRFGFLVNIIQSCLSRWFEV